MFKTKNVSKGLLLLFSFLLIFPLTGQAEETTAEDSDSSKVFVYFGEVRGSYDTPSGLGFVALSLSLFP